MEKRKQRKRRQKKHPKEYYDKYNKVVYIVRPGYVDLRDYELTPEEFKAAAHIQSMYAISVEQEWYYSLKYPQDLIEFKSKYNALLKTLKKKDCIV